MYANLRKVLDWQLLRFQDHDIHAAGSSPPSTLTENLNQTRYREELSALLLLNVWVNGYALMSLAMSVSDAVVSLWDLARSAKERACSLHGACVVQKQQHASLSVVLSRLSFGYHPVVYLPPHHLLRSSRDCRPFKLEQLVVFFTRPSRLTTLHSRLEVHWLLAPP